MVPRAFQRLKECSVIPQDPFCGEQVRADPENPGRQTGAATTVQGVIMDERGEVNSGAAATGGGGLWKVLVGSLWQAGWAGPIFPNNTKGADGKVGCRHPPLD